MEETAHITVYQYSVNGCVSWFEVLVINSGDVSLVAEALNNSSEGQETDNTAITLPHN